MYFIWKYVFLDYEGKNTQRSLCFKYRYLLFDLSFVFNYIFLRGIVNFITNVFV